MKIFVSALRPFLVWVTFQGEKILQWGQRFLQKLSKSQIVATRPYTGGCLSCRLFNLSYPSLAILITTRSHWISFFIQLGTGFKVAPTTRDGPHLCYTIRCMSLPPFHSQFFMNPPPIPTHKSL